MVLKPFFIKDYESRKEEIHGGHSIEEEEKVDGASFHDSSFSFGEESFVEQIEG